MPACLNHTQVSTHSHKLILIYFDKLIWYIVGLVILGFCFQLHKFWNITMSPGIRYVDLWTRSQPAYIFIYAIVANEILWQRRSSHYIVNMGDIVSLHFIFANLVLKYSIYTISRYHCMYRYCDLRLKAFRRFILLLWSKFGLLLCSSPVSYRSVWQGILVPIHYI